MNESIAATEPPPFSPGLDYLFGTLFLACFFIGVPANTFSFWCFVAQRRSVSSIVYTCISAVDCLVCLNSLPVAVTYLTLRDDVMFQSGIYCNMWGLFHRILSSLSIFYVAVLSISRTFVLLMPFRRLRTEVVLVAIGSHFVLQCVEASIPYWENGGKYVYNIWFATCEGVKTPTNKYEQVSNVLNEILFTAPMFPIILSCLVSVFILMRGTEQLQDGQRETKRYASVTIVLFTFIYLIFNSMSIIVNLFNLTNKIGDPGGYFLNFVFYGCVLCNATMNPVLYFIRMQSLRNSIKSLVKKIFDRGSFQLDKNMLSVAPNNIIKGGSGQRGLSKLTITMRLRKKGGIMDGGMGRNLSPRIGETVVLPATPSPTEMEGGVRTLSAISCPNTPRGLNLELPILSPNSHKKLESD